MKQLILKHFFKLSIVSQTDNNYVIEVWSWIDGLLFSLGNYHHLGSDRGYSQPLKAYLRSLAIQDYITSCLISFN